MYNKIAEETFQELYKQYACKTENKLDYSHYLQSVQENGLNLFNVPRMYQTNEVIMTSLETINNPVKLLSRMELERCINKELEKLAPYYHKPITEKDREEFLTDLTGIINFRYNESFYPNYNFFKTKLYTFIDFFSSVTKYYSGMDTICYVYLFRGISIPIRIMENQNKKSYKLLYKAKNKELHLIAISENEYQELRNTLSEKLVNYYKESYFLDEYCWTEPPTETNIIPILQDGEYYESFKTIQIEGVIYDFSRSQIISVPNDVVEFTIPENVEKIPEYCFFGNKSLKKVKIPSTIDSIPKAAFMDCVSLEEVDLSSFGEYEFSRITVDSAAFCNCNSLRQIDMSKLELKHNAQLVFAYCTNLEDISRIKYYVSGASQMNFFHCDSINELNSNTIDDLGEFDFAYCLNLKRVITSRYVIAKGAFCGCENLESFKFKYNNDFRHEFGQYCFAGCNSLKEIDTLKGGALINDYAFLDCTNLEKIIIFKKEEWHTKLSPSAFIGCPNFIIEWSDNSRYPSKETIEAYWKRKGIEVEEKKRREKLVGVKYKERLLKVYDETINIDLDKKRNVLGLFFKKEGKHIGTILMHIFKHDLCTWGEYLKIGRVFYESIPLSSMDDEIDIRTAVVYWAKTCTMQAYLKAPFHNRFDAIQQIYNILKLAHCYFKNNKVVYGEKASEYAEYDVLNTYFDYEEIEERATEEQKAFIEKYTSFSDVRMSYMMQCYLLKHLIAYNKIKDNKEWYYEYANKEIEKLSNHAYSFGNITPSFFNELCRNTWQQFIKNDIEKVFEELGQDDLDFESNTAYYISFDESSGEICRKAESISNTRPLGVNLMISEDVYSDDSQYDEEYNGYGRFAGSYAQDEMGYSDDEIDTIFDGDPDAYWNID